MRHGKSIVRISAAPGLLFPLLWIALGSTPLPAQETEMGLVRGVVKTAEGRGVGGFWLMLVNPDLGMNYRKDVNPIGQFTFTDVYPGTYVFKISPYSYTVVSPSQLEVKEGDHLDITVTVARAPRSSIAGPPLKLPAQHGPNPRSAPGAATVD